MIPFSANGGNNTLVSCGGSLSKILRITLFSRMNCSPITKPRTRYLYTRPTIPMWLCLNSRRRCRTDSPDGSVPHSPCERKADCWPHAPGKWPGNGSRASGAHRHLLLWLWKPPHTNWRQSRLSSRPARACETFATFRIAKHLVNASRNCKNWIRGSKQRIVTLLQVGAPGLERIDSQMTYPTCHPGRNIPRAPTRCGDRQTSK